MSQAARTAVVVGASRGLGRGIAKALHTEGYRVVAVAPASDALDDLAAAHPDIEIEAADAANPNAGGRIIEKYRPDVLGLIAGARPLLRPIHHHCWETFSLNWEVDVRMTFNWIRETLLLPLSPGSLVIAQSSAAAIHGSPMSGGYAGAKATIRFIAAYANDESTRAGLGIRVVAVVPTLTGATELGHETVRAYAERMGVTEAKFLAQLGTPVTPASAGRDFVSLAEGRVGHKADAYSMTGDGLQPLP
jgi:NAD(P)-dependent dehydrogenase (short-subunit alcohol dehydrogenase family)